MQRASDRNADTTRQMREGVDLTVKLAERLQSVASGPHAAR